MATYAVQQGADARCLHNGQASPAVTNTRVRLGGDHAINLPGLWTMQNCGASQPCLTAAWITGSLRVRSQGEPFVVEGGAAKTSTGSPLAIRGIQQRVRFA